MNQELLGDSWYQVLKEEVEKPYFQKLREDLRQEYRIAKIYPAPSDIFRAFKLTPFEETRVIIIGQDPYPFGNTADGLAFSTRSNDTPASLRYILREVDRDVVKTTNHAEYKNAFPTNSLEAWAKQGVLLLNSSLTVRAGVPKSHEKLGWQEFINFIISNLWQDTTPKTFVIWGSEARNVFSNGVQGLSDTGHLILDTGHPASGTHGKDKFSGCNHFSKINHYFYRKGLPEINWKLND